MFACLRSDFALYLFESVTNCLHFCVSTGDIISVGLNKAGLNSNMCYVLLQVWRLHSMYKKVTLQTLQYRLLGTVLMEIFSNMKLHVQIVRVLSGYVF